MAGVMILLESYLALCHWHIVLIPLGACHAARILATLHVSSPAANCMLVMTSMTTTKLGLMFTCKVGEAEV